MSSLYGYILVAVLIAAGALIAYLGDFVGRSLGRRRLTIFGLRPRHTAVLFSVISGVVITIITLGGATLISQDVRTGLFHVRELRDEQARLEAEVRRLTGDLRTLQDQMNALQPEYARVSAELQQSEGKLRQVEGSLAEANQRLTRAQEQVGEAETRVAAASQRYQQAQQRLDATEEELAEAEEELLAAERELAQRQGDLVEAKDAHERLVEQTSEFREALDAEVTALRGQRDTLLAEIEEARQFQFGAFALLSELRDGRIIFQKDDEVDRGVIEPHADPAVVKGELRLLLRRLNARALARGARGQGGSAIVVAQLESGSEGLTVYDEETVLDSLVAAIQQAGRSAVVRGLAAVNTVAGQRVPIRFELINNQVVYRAGQPLTAVTLAAADNELNLLLEVMRALQLAGLQARQRGVLPALAAADGTDPGGSSVPSVGDIGFTEMVEAVRRIRAQQGRVQLSIVAAFDTTVAGPLRVDLRVQLLLGGPGPQVGPQAPQ